jgi:hypothetical protein
MLLNQLPIRIIDDSGNPKPTLPTHFHFKHNVHLFETVHTDKIGSSQVEGTSSFSTQHRAQAAREPSC